MPTEEYPYNLVVPAGLSEYDRLKYERESIQEHNRFSLILAAHQEVTSCFNCNPLKSENEKRNSFIASLNLVRTAANLARHEGASEGQIVEMIVRDRAHNG